MVNEPLNEETIFNVARKIYSAEARLEYLDQVCGNNLAIYGRVSMLLQLHDEEQSFLESTPPGLAPSITSPISPANPGTQIGPYKLREKIGEGGFGDVFVAEQETPIARKVALKIIKPGMATKNVIARFEAERQALALMEHPNVARVLDAGATSAGQPYFVMELVHGMPIVEFCDAQSLSNRDRLLLFVDVCHAVQHAHHKGVIHRDLKPSNIMVTMHDDRPVPKVIDFGVAKALSQKLTENTVYTAYGHMVGTPLYMSPEQAQLSGLDVDTRSDVYSLGVLLYELLTGSTPFDRETLEKEGLDEVRRIIIEDDPLIPSVKVSTLKAEMLSTVSDRRKIDQRNLSESLRGELDWIVMKALEKNRTRRYETVSNLAQDVENHLNDAPVAACPPSLVYRWTKFARRHRTALTTTALVSMALIVGTCLSTWQAVRASAAQSDADEQREAAVLTAERAQRNEEAARRQRDAAVAAREKLRRVLYASEMNLVQAAWEAGSFRRVAQLLHSTQPEEDEVDLRGFEWRYWSRQLDLRNSGKEPTPRRDWSLAPIEDAGEHNSSQDEVNNGSLNSDGTRAALLTDMRHFWQPSVVRVWDVPNDREMCYFRETRPNRSLDGPVFAPSDKRLAVVSHDARFSTSHNRETHKGEQQEPAEVIIVDTNTGKTLLTIEPEKALEITGLAFGPKTRWIAAVVVQGSSSDQATCRLMVWDAATGREALTIGFEDEKVQLVGFPLPSGWATPQFIGFTPNGKELVIASRRGGVTFYDASNGRPLRVIAPEGTALSRYGGWSLSRDGRQLAVIGLERFKNEIGVAIYDALSGKIRHQLPLHTKYPPIAMAWNEVGSRLVLLGSGGNGGAIAQVALWDTVTGRLVLTLKHEGLQQHQLWRDHIRFSDHGRRLVHVVANKTSRNGVVHPIQIWDASPLQNGPDSKSSKED